MTPLQVLRFAAGGVIPKSSSVVGHIVSARSFPSNDIPSKLAIRFDKIVTNKQALPVTVFVRALANTNESYEAMGPTPPADVNLSGERRQIGGDLVEPLDKHVLNSDEDIGAENRKDGIYAKLLPAEHNDRYTHIACDGTPTEQPVAIHSANACGLYGFVQTFMTHTGKTAPLGTFQLESRRHTVTLYARSTALLQVLSEESEPAGLR
jgi:hypothetical protein